MAALEFVLVLPSLILLLVIGITLGQALYVRSKLGSAAASSARVCALEQALPEACAQLVKQEVSPVADWCNQMDVTVGSVVMPGLQYAEGYQVKIDCDFAGTFARDYMRDNKLVLHRLTVSATMAY